MTEATLKELGEANWKARLAAMEEVAWRKNHNLMIHFLRSGELETIRDGGDPCFANGGSSLQETRP